jgi:hypothetical protein
VATGNTTYQYCRTLELLQDAADRTETLYRLLFVEGNRDAQCMGITFAKRLGNISARHVRRYTELLTEWAGHGIFIEGITMMERGVSASCSLHVHKFFVKIHRGNEMCSIR